MNTALLYLGHACFKITQGNTTILFDPFLTENPFKIMKADEITSCSYIFVSHGHFDHLGDAIAIAKKTGATIISTAEIANMCAQEGCNAHKMHIGGKHTFDFGFVRITPALHGAGIPGGLACGFIVNFFDTNIYFSGDTGLFGDMKLLSELEKIDYALVPIGGNFTMDPIDAARAVKMLQPKAVIPMHYNTWPLIAQDPQIFKAAVNNLCEAKVIIVNPGETISIS